MNNMEALSILGNIPFFSLCEPFCKVTTPYNFLKIRVSYKKVHTERRKIPKMSQYTILFSVWTFLYNKLNLFVG